MGQKVVKIAVKGATTIKLEDLEPFQGDLRTLERSEYEALRENILKHGFSFTMHVWQHRKKNYIIDGHQRLFTLKKLAEDEGYKVPPVPVSLVQASSFKEAKLKVLAGVANYGKMTEKSLGEYLKINDIPIDEIVTTFKFPGIDILKLTEAIEQMEKPTVESIEFNLQPMRVSGDGVKQVVLFFDTETHDEFMVAVNKLSKHYKKENISDTLAEVVNEAVGRIEKKRS
jgi:hypothetical protein